MGGGFVLNPKINMIREWAASQVIIFLDIPASRVGCWPLMLSSKKFRLLQGVHLHLQVPDLRDVPDPTQKSPESVSGVMN